MNGISNLTEQSENVYENKGRHPGVRQRSLRSCRLEDLKSWVVRSGYVGTAVARRQGAFLREQSENVSENKGRRLGVRQRSLRSCRLENLTNWVVRSGYAGTAVARRQGAFLREQSENVYENKGARLDHATSRSPDTDNMSLYPLLSRR
jgi:hypothetical protein